MRNQAVLTLVCAATFLVYLDTSITPVAIPAISEDLGAGPTTVLSEAERKASSSMMICVSRARSGRLVLGV